MVIPWTKENVYPTKRPITTCGAERSLPKKDGTNLLAARAERAEHGNVRALSFRHGKNHQNVESGDKRNQSDENRVTSFSSRNAGTTRGFLPSKWMLKNPVRWLANCSAISPARSGCADELRR